MNQKTSRVLIVDDMQVNRMILSSLLAAGGVACDQAESGEAISARDNEDVKKDTPPAA